MNPAHWFNAQSFPATPYHAEPYGLSCWSAWDTELERWRYFAQGADGVVVETDEIGVPL